MTGPVVKTTTRAGIIPANPLPSVLEGVRFRRPADLSVKSVVHFEVAPIHGEQARISAYGLAHKTATQLKETGQQPLVIEASPVLLDDDITDGIGRGGLKDQLDKCHSIFFCSDLYDMGGERLSSFAPRLTPSGRPDIYLNVRTEGGLFLRGLGYFPPLAQPLAWLKARGQSDSALALSFLQSLNLTSAVHSLLKDFPEDQITRGYFLGMLRASFTQARVEYERLARTQLTGTAEGLPEEAIRLFESLSQQPLIQPVEEMAGRVSGN